MFTHLSSLKSYPSTDLIAFGAWPPIASNIFGFPIGSLGRTRGEVNKETESSSPILPRFFGNELPVDPRHFAEEDGNVAARR